MYNKWLMDEGFNPADRKKYKSVKDLPKEEQKNFRDVEGGFVTENAFLEAQKDSKQYSTQYRTPLRQEAANEDSNRPPGTTRVFDGRKFNLWDTCPAGTMLTCKDPIDKEKIFSKSKNTLIGIEGHKNDTRDGEQPRLRMWTGRNNTWGSWEILRGHVQVITDEHDENKKERVTVVKLLPGTVVREIGSITPHQVYYLSPESPVSKNGQGRDKVSG